MALSTTLPVGLSERSTEGSTERSAEGAEGSEGSEGSEGGIRRARGPEDSSG